MIVIDGCRGGCIAANHTGDSWEVWRTGSLDELEFDKAIIDVPVAISDEGTRRCDRGGPEFPFTGKTRFCLQLSCQEGGLSRQLRGSLRYQRKYLR
ncbi:MAG: DUF429 domain-containing protein [Candidatus Nanohaloarchaea archaeon]